MVESNSILYAKGAKPDYPMSCLVHHIVNVSNTSYAQVVIKYVRAIDKCTSEICMGGHNIIVIHNTCEVARVACAKETN